MKKLMVLGLLIAALYSGLKWDVISANRFPGSDICQGCTEDVQPSLALSDLTMDRFEQLRWDKSYNSLVLSSVEISSVVRYAIPGIIPPGLLEPRIEFEGEQVRLSGLVVAREFPGLPRMDEIVGLLPDTMAVEMQGVIASLDQSHFSLVIDQLWMVKIPMPSSLIPAILTAFGREERGGLPRNALLIPKPDGIESAFVQGDRLFLSAIPEREEFPVDGEN